MNMFEKPITAPRVFAEGVLLKKIRKARKLSQEETGKEMGVSGFAVCSWEHGRRPHTPNMDKLLDWIDLWKHAADDAAQKPYSWQDDVWREPATEPITQNLNVPNQNAGDDFDYHIVDRHGELPLRFLGREIGNAQVGAGFLILYRTKAGTTVWEYDGDAGFGSDEECFSWVQSHPDMQRDPSLLRQFLTDCGLLVYVEVP
jgi:transcriptional regulator with XRE-family HTH domain